MITPLPLGEGKGEGPAPSMNPVCSVLLCFSVRKRRYPRYEIRPMRLAAEFFLSQSAQSSLSILAHVSSSQKASGIQRTQSVTAIAGVKNVRVEAQ